MIGDNDFDPDKFRQALLNGGINADAKARQRADKVQRKIAEEERDSKADKKGSKPTFLRPADIAGDYDLKRALQTTLGMPDGMTRALTRDDIAAFAKNIDTLADHYKGGITVEQVISLSAADDIDRANKQIHIAQPVSRKAGLVHFVTNASKDSKLVYHHVHVEYQAFDQLVFNTDQIKKTTVANRLAKGKVKFECDCGRYKYWYRYINTVGGTGLGRKEAGYPKIRNPNMTGIACKHILRVMQWSKSAMGQRWLEQALNTDRTKQAGVKYKTGKSALKQQIAEQMVKANTKRNQIVPKLQDEMRKLEQKAKRRAADMARRMATVQTKTQALNKIKMLRDQGILSDAEYKLLSKNLGVTNA